MASDDTTGLVLRALSEWGEEPGRGFEDRILARLGLDRPAPEPVPAHRRLGARLVRTPRPVLMLIAGAAILCVLAASAFSFRGALFGWTAGGLTPPGGGSVEAQATAEGYQITVTDSYDDGQLIIVPWSVTSTGGAIPRGDEAVVGSVSAVYDSRGDNLYNREQSTGTILDDGFAVARDGDGAPAGSPVTIQVSSVLILKPVQRGANRFPTVYRTIKGEWALHLTPKAGGSTALSAPPPAQLGPVTIRFTSVRVSGEELSVHMAITGGKNQAGSQPATLYGPNGKQIYNLLYETPTGYWSNTGKPGVGPGEQGTWDFVDSWQLQAQPGVYRMVMTNPQGQQLTELFDVPHGHDPGVPVFYGNPFTA